MTDSHERSLPTFSLFALLVGMSVSGCCLAVFRLLGPVAAGVCLTFFVAAGAHVLASWITSRGRRSNSRRLRGSGRKPHSTRVANRPDASMTQRDRTSARHIWLLSYAAAAGSSAGLIASTRLPGDEVNAAVIAVCMFSGAMLLAFAVLLVSNLATQIWHGLEAAYS